MLMPSAYVIILVVRIAGSRRADVDVEVINQVLTLAEAAEALNFKILCKADALSNQVGQPFRLQLLLMAQIQQMASSDVKPQAPKHKLRSKQQIQGMIFWNQSMTSVGGFELNWFSSLFEMLVPT